MQLKLLLGAAGLAACATAAAQVTLYEDQGFRGRTFTADSSVWDFDRYSFSERAQSAVITSGRWEACEDTSFHGRCVILMPGTYPSLDSMALTRRVASVRLLDSPSIGYVPPATYVVPPATTYVSPPTTYVAPTTTYVAPATTYVAPAPTYVPARPAVVLQPDDGQRYQARVTSVRAVLGAPGQQCWVEKQEIGPLELPGAIIGGAIDLLSGRESTQYIQRCAYVPRDARANYWDVTYEFRGVEHRVQLSAPPGSTVAVNGYGQIVG
jgi:hypothetical protein